MEENKITISKFEYDYLNRIKYKYEFILSAIFNNTYLNYDDTLNYDYEQIDKILKIIESTYYKTRLRQLNIEEENKEDENENN